MAFISFDQYRSHKHLRPVAVKLAIVRFTEGIINFRCQSLLSFPEILL